MNRFNFNLLFALDAILHANTLTEAANNVHLSQPAMSVSLKKLRAYFKDDLVVYAGGESRPTALALALKPRVRAILQAAREAINLSLDFDPASDERTLTVTAADVVELMFLNSVVSILRREAPGISINSLPFTYQAVDVLFREPIDVAIVSEAFALPQFPTAHLFDETISCMVWSGNDVIGETISEAQYFGGYHAAMHHSPERLVHPVGAALHNLNVQRNIAVRTSVYSALPQIIVGTDLIVTTLTRFANQCAQTMPIRVLKPPVDMPVISFVAQWQDYRKEEPVIKWLVSKLKQAAETI